MRNNRGRRLATASGAIAAVIAGVGAGAIASARPAATSPELVVAVTYAHKQLTVSPGTTFQAGRVTITYHAAKGEHDLQLARLHKGYSKSQFKQDIGAAFEKGDKDAIRRVDKRVTWLGGASSIGGSTGTFSVRLPAGTIWAFDQESNAAKKLTVTGPAADRPGVSSSVVVRATIHHTWVSPKTLPNEGWIKLRNTADQPHFAVLQRVKESTTGKDVRQYIKSGSEAPPSWGLKESTDSGVFSPGTTTALKLDLPAGKYLLACFWPDKKTGMPHFMMGMWKLVHLK